MLLRAVRLCLEVPISPLKRRLIKPLPYIEVQDWGEMLVRDSCADYLDNLDREW